MEGMEITTTANDEREDNARDETNTHTVGADEGVRVGGCVQKVIPAGTDGRECPARPTQTVRRCRAAAHPNGINRDNRFGPTTPNYNLSPRQITAYTGCMVTPSISMMEPT